MASSFKDMSLSDPTKKGLLDSGFTTPTDIQRDTIGLALEGNDVLGAAKTGSGKTLAFLIPMLELLHREKWNKMDGLGALIITPTRELAYQIFEVLKAVGRYHTFSAGLVIGGKDLKFEFKRLDTCNIIVCTPGRLLQHMDTNPLFQWDQLKILILDEADRILDLGFAKTMNSILDNLPKERQTLLFSATQTKSVKDLARLSLKKPKFVSTAKESSISTPDGLTQSYTVCEHHEKMDLLFSFLKSHPKQKMIVFLASCKQVKYTYELFCRLKPGTSLLALYGTLHQLRRMSIYDEFCSKQSAVLFATDIASRGLDFPAVNWVVQLDAPEDANTYIHRVGRTARFFGNGQSLLVLTSREEKAMMSKLKEKKIPLQDVYVNPRKQMTIRFKAQAFCARDVQLKESAQRAFKAYIKSIHLMKDKEVFDVSSIDLDKCAKSLGLEVTPRIRFLENKTLKNKKPEVKKNRVKKFNEDGDPIEEPDVNEKLLQSEKVKQVSLFGGDDSSDTDEDDSLFTVKSTWTPDSVIPSNLPPLEEVKRDKQKNTGKLLTKAAIVKKLSKKKILPNKRIVFNEEGEPVEESVHTTQQSSKVKELEEKGIEGGLDINLAKEIMAEEDAIDKKLHRKVIQEKKKLRKQKEKEVKKRDEAKGRRSALLKDDEEDNLDEITSRYIDELPDPDAVFSQEGDEGDSDDGQAVKRRRLASSSSSSGDEVDREFKGDEDLDLSDHEDLALHLLQAKR